jgi:hypothetical protein
MIRNIKIHNILNIIEISKSMELNKCTHQKKLSVSYDFSKFDGSKKSRCDDSQWYHPRILSLEGYIL